MTKPEKVEQFTPSVLDERLENLKKLFPEFFTEGKLDLPKIRGAFRRSRRGRYRTLSF